MRRLFSIPILGAMLPMLASAAPVDFNRDVLPILSDACFHCHGPDEKAREADLRLDTKEGLLRTVDGITVVKPGAPAESELILRIESTDRDEVMPPPKATRKLTAEEIATLKRWVAEGAPWGRHWAFEPMARPTPPENSGRTEIDRFIVARLEKEGLSLSPEADKERLLRRVTLDLTGLPPTPQERAAFLGDSSPDAYEKLVERLLASPAYGERMAAEWLDVARFADTHGYQMDAERPVWPYRDWVIRAFNENLPYDKFTEWQIAGDLLPNATKEQKLATAFNRLHSQNEEGGVIEEEFRVAYVVDRVNTFGTAFLGMTFECARCHDHKYDPLTMRDFYSLFAFFQNIDEAGQIPFTGFVPDMPEPVLLLSTDEQDRKLAAMAQTIADREQALAKVRQEAGGAFEAWLSAKGAMPELQAIGRFEFESLDKREVPNLANEKAKPAKTHESPKLIPGKSGQAALLDGENGFTFPELGHFNRASEFSLGLWLKPPAKHADRAVVVHHSRAPVDAGSRGYELLLEDGRVSFGLHHMWPGNSLKVTTREAIAPGEWTHVAVSYDGSSRAAGARIYINGKPAAVEVVRDGLWKDITYGGEPELAIGFRFRDRGFKDGAVDDFRVFDRALTALEAAQFAGGAALEDAAKAWNAAPGTLTAEQREILREFFLARSHAPVQGALAELKAARDEQRRFIQPIPEIMVMRELPEPKPASILERGNYDQHGQAVAAATPEVMPVFPPDQPRNRLGLARWLLDPEHPLMARVTVNRLWQMMFGRGLVETSDNFGTQGARPTHPELLDWLARDFIASGWNVKATLKKIAMSAAYRQSSKATPELLARDPQNELLARGPVRRLTAEMLRDQALAVSGLLVAKIGGPSVKPYQPPGLWEEIAMGRPTYAQGKGDDLHRRSLYTFWKRTVPPPSMVIFDAADRSYCTVKRQSTSTPSQALALLNDVQQVEAARFVAARMLQEGGAEARQRAAFAFQLVTGRSPRAAELEVMERLLAEQRELFAAEPEAAKKLAAFGEAKTPENLDPVDLAAATVLAQALLNHDEAVMCR